VLGGGPWLFALSRLCPQISLMPWFISLFAARNSLFDGVGNLIGNLLSRTMFLVYLNADLAPNR